MYTTIREKKFIANRVQVPYNDLSQGYLRSEVALGNQSTIDFILQRNKTTPLITERLLDLNDSFVITHLFIGLKQIAADAPSAAQQLAAKVQTWDDPNIFSGTNAANVTAIYNSSLRWTIDRKEYIPQFPVRGFYRVPETQTGTDVGYASSGVNTVNGFPVAMYGFYPQEPTLINGEQTLNVSIDLGTAINFDDATNTVYAVLEARGFLVVNSGR